LDWRVARVRAGGAIIVAAFVAVLALSGDAATDPPVPRGFPGVVPAFMGGGAPDADRRWLARARPLGPGAPRWARRMHRRSLLVLRALTDRRTGAAVAGAREGWAYVWPRDAGAVAIAFAAAGFRAEARRVARFLLDLDLEAAARFRRTGEPVPVRDAQGDAAGWVAAAARAAGTRLHGTEVGGGAWLHGTEGSTGGGAWPQAGSSICGVAADRPAWRDRADYHEGDPGDYLGNAIATAGLAPRDTCALDEQAAGSVRAEAARVEPARVAVARSFRTSRGLVRVAGEPDSGLDSAAAWAVRPFRIELLHPAAGRTLRRLAAGSGRFGILPSERWQGGEDPWTAPTAWSAWGLAALAHESDAPANVRRHDRRAGLRLLAALRRASTPHGLLPERVDAETGAPRSTTPLAWSHAFAILALRSIYRRRSRPR
jgi:hypothetical protein